MRLDPARFKQTEHVNTRHSVTLEEGVTLDDVMEEDFFANVAVKVLPYDHIEVRTDDGAFYAELLVISAGKTWVRTILLLKKEIQSKDEVTASFEGYDVVYKGPHKKFCVIRKKDSEMVHEGSEDKAAAIKWLTEHLST